MSQEFSFRVREAMLNILKPTFEFRFFEKGCLDLINSFVGAPTELHEFAERLFENFKRQQLQGGHVWWVVLSFNGKQYQIKNGYNQWSTPHTQYLEIHPTKNSVQIRFKADTPRSENTEENIAELRGLVENVVNVLLRQKFCKGCGKLSREGLCRLCTQSFNLDPCSQCGCSFGTLKNGVHKHCAPQRTKKRRRVG